MNPMTYQKEIHFSLDLILGLSLSSKGMKEADHHTSVGRSYVVLHKVVCQLVNAQVAQVLGLVLTQTGCCDLDASIVALMVYMWEKDKERNASVRAVQQNKIENTGRTDSRMNS